MPKLEMLSIRDDCNHTKWTYDMMTNLKNFPALTHLELPTKVLGSLQYETPRKELYEYPDLYIKFKNPGKPNADYEDLKGYRLVKNKSIMESYFFPFICVT